MLTKYRQVLGLPGALAFSLSGLVARLPMSMVGLGLVVLVSTETGSYSLAGTVSASYVVAGAVFALFQARLVDRLGQHRVLPITVLVSMTALATTMIAVEAGWPTPVPHLLAALSGATLPTIGSAVRARWSRLVPDKSRLQTAFAFEAMVDELVFVVGPSVVTLLATTVHPTAGLVAAMVAAVSGTLFLSAQRRTEPPAAHVSREDGREPMGWPVLGPLVAASLCMGGLFGGCEVATVALSEHLGDKAAAGPLLGIWAAGSAISALVVGALHWKASNPTRFRWALLALAALILPLPFVRSFAVLGVVLFLAGFAISPGLIASVAWIEETVPNSRLTEGMAVLSTALTAGVAPGSAAVGWVVDRSGASTSFWVPIGAGLTGAAIAFATTAVRRPAPRREPTAVAGTSP